MTKPAPLLVKPEFMLLEDLLSEIQRGSLRIPRFQRPYVWKPEDMLRLLDSIQRGYPIGSLLLWDTREPIASMSLVGPLAVPDAGDEPVTHVLDGQQRLSTLYAVLRLPPEFPTDGRQKHWQWWIYYDLKEHKFLHLRNGPIKPWLLPLRALLRTTDFLKEARRIESELGAEQAAKLIDRAESLAQVFKSYKVPIIRIQGGRLDDALDIFTRLNATGHMILDPDQMLSTLTYREGEDAFHLATRIDAILEGLAKYHFDGIRRAVVFRAIVAAAGFDVHSRPGEELIRFIRDESPDTVDIAEQAMLRAAAFLFDELGVPGDRLLPYSNQFLLLSELCRICPDPTPAQKQILRKWFWATSFSGWFAGANSTQIRLALDEIRALAQGTIQDLQVMPLDAQARPCPERFDMRSARLRALLLTIIQRLAPRDADGQVLDARRLIWEHGNHAFLHIFRRAPDRILSHPANRILLPVSRGQGAREMLLGIPDEALAEVLASHGIPAAAYEALVRGDAAGFVALRAHCLAQLERNFMTELGLTLPTEELGEADIDTGDEA